MKSTRVLRIVPFCVAAALAACTGNGSDIGPSFAKLPDGTCKALVLDDDGNGVCGAIVRVGSGSGVTGKIGRAELYGDRRGTQLVRVDATNASAKDNDRLASIAFVTSVIGPDLPAVIYLPDTNGGVAVTLGTGTALPQTDLDDSASTGAILRLDAGTVVADGAAATIRLRIGDLAASHLPVALPTASNGAWLCSRGFWVDPPTATFAQGATLLVPDELALGAASCALFRLDPITGQWQQAVGSATSSGGLLRLANAVTTGGLYVYAFDAQSATVRGRVLDAADRAVPNAQLRVDSALVTTGSDGRFAAVVAGIDAQGASRSVVVEAVGGPTYLPIAGSYPTAALGVGADADLGDLDLETTAVGNVRVQWIRRGRGQTSRRVAVGGGLESVSSLGFTDYQGQCTLEDVPAGWFGGTSAFLVGPSTASVNELLSNLGAGSRVVSNRYYFSDRSVFSGGRSTRILSLDSTVGAQLQGAAVVRGRTAGQGFLGTTRESGAVIANRETFDRLTASISTTVGGSQTTSAFSVEGPSGDLVHLPLERQQKSARGAFDRHGVVHGAITGFDPTREHAVIASRPLEFDEWFAQKLQGATPTSSMPTRIGGQLPQDQYRAGVALPSGNVAIAQGNVVGARFTLTNVGALLGLQVAEGTSEERDLAVDQAATETFAVADALVGYDASFGPLDLRFDLAFQQANGLVADVARDIAGNMVVNGDDVSFALPALDGAFAGGAWLVVLSAQASDSSTARAQRSVLRIAAATVESFPMLELPTIVSPLNGASVASSGFTAQFTAPAGATYAQLELRSEGLHTRTWTAVVPATTTEFAFVTLPTEAVSPLAPALSWTFTVSAWRVDTGPYQGNPDYYSDMPTLWLGLGQGDQGVRAMSSRTVTITTN